MHLRLCSERTLIAIRPKKTGDSDVRPPRPQQNHLLATLPDEVLERLLPHLELVDMPLGMVLYESGDTLRHVYFPTNSIVSLLYVMESGASAEISVVGNDGVIGVALFMGGGEHHQPRDCAKCRQCLPGTRQTL